ncbi:MAG: AraC family transcriptional regulator [Verrucomicrobia bacterium]|nr:AraC family transcriptional regulator [Verrucomicrobiota bacterium]
MANADKSRVNRGAYSSPFSGVGLEFFPLGIVPDHSGLVLHESGYLRRNRRWNFPNVFSPFWRLYYDFAPGHQLVFPDKTVALGPDRFVLVPSRSRFHCRGDRAVRTLWLHFNCARHLVSGQVVPIKLKPTSAEAECLAELVQLLESNKETEINNRIFGFSVALLHLVLNRPEIHWLEGISAGVLHAVQHIEEHFSADLYIPALARIAGMSVRSFMRSFSRQYRLTPGQFIAQVRVREAAHLLLSTDESLEQIAEKTGFRDRAYLTRVFKRLTHEAPAAFRRRHKLGQSALVQ